MPPTNNRKPKTKEPGRSERSERVEDRSPEAMRSMQDRSDAFSRALNRKGMPMTWGTGVLRTDAAWKRDQEYDE